MGILHDLSAVYLLSRPHYSRALAPEYEYSQRQICQAGCQGSTVTKVCDMGCCGSTRLTRYTGSLRHSRNHSRAGSLGRLLTAFTSDRSRQSSFRDGHLLREERVWYDQFTSTDWVHDSIADAHRVKALRNRKDVRGRIESFFDGAQGWILSALVGFLTACLAYTVDIAEAPVFDWKDGYCSKGFFLSEKVSRNYPRISICCSVLSWPIILKRNVSHLS